MISFVTSGIMWANHHSMFRLIDRSTHGLVVANLLLLLCVSFVPFPTKVLAEYLPVGGHDQRAAVLFFRGTYVVIALFYNVVWRVAVTDHRLIAPGCEEEADEITRAIRYGVPGYAMATLLTFVAVPASLAVDAALALYHPAPRRASSQTDAAQPP